MAGPYKPNRRGLEHLATSPQMQRVVTAEAHVAESVAVGLAEDFRETGEYADSFEVRELETTVNRAHPHKAASAKLVNTSGHAAAVEWGYAGSKDEPGKSAHHTLKKSLDALGHR